MASFLTLQAEGQRESPGDVCTEKDGFLPQALNAHRFVKGLKEPAAPMGFHSSSRPAWDTVTAFETLSSGTETATCQRPCSLQHVSSAFSADAGRCSARLDDAV